MTMAPPRRWPGDRDPKAQHRWSGTQTGGGYLMVEILDWSGAEDAG
jgi:hypothetical protein